MPDWIVALRAEWSTISAAPWSTFVVACVAATIGFLVCRWAYQARLDIAADRLLQAKEHLDGKEAVIQDYRQRLGLDKSPGGKYARMTNNELQTAVMNFVGSLRTWFAAAEAEYRGRSEAQWQTMVRASSEEERHATWVRQSQATSDGLRRLMSDFESQFKVEAIVLRDELTSRMAPGTAPQTDELMIRYEHPTNALGIRAVVDDLERRARQLA